VTASTLGKGTAGCTSPATADADWCYNAGNGQFWPATANSDITITGRVKENTM
jgi:hypothetical protein